MKYTLHTWEIEHTENGPVAKNKKEFETTNHAELMERLKAINGKNIQFFVNRKKIDTPAI